jgi:hypothetical protein
MCPVCFPDLASPGVGQSHIAGHTFAVVRLYDLQCVIAELTVADAHYVKRLDPPSWGRFLQIMEDAVDDSPSQTWIVSVLYSTAAQHVTTRAAMKSLLTANA